MLPHPFLLQIHRHTLGNTLYSHTHPKIDRLFDWQRNPNSGVKETIKRQKPSTKNQFDERVKLTVTEFAEKVV